MTVLDCTLRDGGYYTNWEFSTEFVAAYLQTCQVAGVDVVELGYIGSGDSRGRFARLGSEAVSEVLGPATAPGAPRLAAMLDASEALKGDAWTHCVSSCREVDGGAARIDLVRVAVRYSALASVAPVVAALTGDGVPVTVNLMQIDLASEREIAACLATVAGFGPGVEAVYLADSLGGMRPERVRELCDRFRSRLPGSTALGFHGHDNLGLALHNGLTSLESGATWLDAAMGGMGRGAGNTRTELLLTALGERERHRLAKLYGFVASHLNPLQEEKRWGTSALYAMAGVQAIHPTYAQVLTQDDSLPVEEKLAVLERLVAGEPASAFHVERLRTALAAQLGTGGG